MAIVIPVVDGAGPPVDGRRVGERAHAGHYGGRAHGWWVGARTRDGHGL